MKSWTAPTATSVKGKPVDEVPVVGSEYSFPSLPTSAPIVKNVEKDETGNTKQPTATPTKGKKKNKKGIPLDIWGTGTSPTPTPTLPSQYASAVKKAPIPGSQQHTPVEAKSPPRYRVERPVKVDIPWLETGSAASSVYTEYRAEAVSLAHMRYVLNYSFYRNQLFNQARDSFVAGKKAHAKSLSAQGHALNDRMHALHRQASESIFQSRNSGGGELLVDLHGLHPDEAVRHAKERVQGIKRRGVKVYIVAGTGHHSRGRAKVLPVVREALEESGYKVREGTNRGSSEGGVLIIYL
jgi:hypothetical protein